VFTIPSELNPLVMLAPEVVYDILFKTSASVLSSTASDQKYLGAKVGFISVLHTWGQNLSLHPHVHMIVTGGGVAGDGSWKNSRKKFFLPVKVLSKRFRHYFLTELKRQFPKERLKDQKQFQDILDICFKKDWVIYSKKPMKDPYHVIKYLGRYTHRIAISNGRIKSHIDNKVTFSYKDL
jgi:Putative transposase.